MGTKRSHTQTSSDSSSLIHVSRKSNVSSVPKRKRRGTRIEKANPTSVNLLKKRIRDLSRLLERAENMPADVRMDSERAVSAYIQELAAAEGEKLKKKMAKRYHMVKFFERQKATRRLKQLNKRLSVTTSPTVSNSLQEQLHIAEVDLNYILYYPPDRKYVGLYPQRRKADSDNDNEHGREAVGGDRSAMGKGDPAIWKEIERRMAAGTLTEALGQVGEVGQRMNIDTEPMRKKSRKGKGKKDIGGKAKMEDSHVGSDGGFFDE